MGGTQCLHVSLEQLRQHRSFMYNPSVMPSDSYGFVGRSSHTSQQPWATHESSLLASRHTDSTRHGQASRFFTHVPSC